MATLNEQDDLRLVGGKFSERDFVEAFENCTYPLEDFHHREHLHLVWLYVHEDAEQAATRMVESIRRYAASRGVSEHYHNTLTLVWARLVAAAVRQSAVPRFHHFLDLHPELLNKRLPYEYYSDGLLSCPAARGGWVEPDSAPLPD